MYVYVLPISGGYMPAQLELITILSESGYRPDVAFGCSGGNMTAYVGMAANWNSKKIREIVKDLCESIKMRSKTKMSTISIALGLVSSENGMYSETGVEELYKKYITPDVNKRTEIWTGSYNKLTNKSVFFCNRSSSDAIIDSNVDKRMAMIEDPVFVGDNVDKLFLVSKSSATIPMLLPDVYIDGEAHIDGGLNWSTPAVPLIEHLERDHHVVHISGSNMDIPDMRLRSKNVISETFRVFSIMSEGHIVKERHSLYQHMKSLARLRGLTIYREFTENASVNTLVSYKEKSDLSKYSLLILNPLYNRTTKLYDLEYESLRRVMDMTRKHFVAELIYLQ